ncbi:hypothetical protein M0G43_09340 [Subsaxibacter sp. CAU 1640]|uniref:DUF6119 family protein n=1 Tax=Subsaxibacter sp. CAU 1640 TaxID=2933271 RepID=UPI002003B069|nr:DUF6119 family protein [Subsaxibacter sp. CAU 1640]MCK7590777.1 hypothetical protein [Subsaxibacter sp. CAU 1640]
MDIEKFKMDFKVFKIDESFYELRNKGYDDVIETIKNNHIKKLRHKFNNLDIKLVDPKITSLVQNEFDFRAYSFRQPKEKFYLKVFLPDELTDDQNFNIVEFSFVLFIKYHGEIYCIISGSGMNVIKKYLHPTFGIEIYQRLAKPTEDNVLELYVRSIANNISSKKETFNLNQTILETLVYSDIPTKIKLKMRSDLKANEFKEFKLDKNLALMEVGSYFYLRSKINFEELKHLISKLDNIYFDYNPQKLTLFSKVNDSNLIKNLDDYLIELVIDDIQAHINPEKVKYVMNEIIEVVHPSKLERFYECDKFVIKYKFARGNNYLDVYERADLYYKATKYIYDSIENINERFEIKQSIYKLNILGYVNQREITFANFFSHVTAEIDFLGYKYFKIDGHWYILEDAFLNLMNEDAKSYYIKYLLKENLLKPWNKDDDEDAYNKSHDRLPNYYVLDKILKDNIELCDILTIRDNVAYFIHVKNGFNTTMRDLYIQLILSAKRLSNDLKNTKGISYLKKTLTEYNRKNPKKKMDVESFLNKVAKKEISINFVMAFKNNHHKTYPILERIDRCKSNIAKYSIVQAVKEMQAFDFGISLIDISDL